MGRRRKVLDVNETLSQETPKVQEELLKEIVKPEDEVNPDKNKKKKSNNLSIKKEKSPEFKPGDRIKLKPNIKFDLLGRRIHNGLKNYQYRILSIRIDGKLVIECLTHCFTVNPEDVDKI